ncbi:uncharacterized protein [Rutidosis leptorrhynchoides]|uniref:uncharacterized protein n=1 Tax=Rutidosis leptorrhynchoides TaxID=125765 RepID=UPI003A999DB8
MGKQHQKHFPRYKAWRSKGILELVHTDICGPMRTPSLNQNRYFILFIDDYSIMTWVYFKCEKAEVFTILKKFKNFIEKSSGHYRKTLRSDRGKEYTSTQVNKFCEDEGVKRQLTVGYALSKMASLNAKIELRDVEFDEGASWNREKDKVGKQTYLPRISIETPSQQSLQMEHSKQDESTGETSSVTPTSQSTTLPITQDDSSPESTPERVKALAEVYETCNFITIEPESYEVAAKDAKCVTDMNEEIKMIEKNNTWKLVDHPKDKEIIGVKWVYRTKLNTDGSIQNIK